jgi:hypothetical protein
VKESAAKFNGISAPEIVKSEIRDIQTQARGIAGNAESRVGTFGGMPAKGWKEKKAQQIRDDAIIQKKTDSLLECFLEDDNKKMLVVLRSDDSYDFALKQGEVPASRDSS